MQDLLKSGKPNSINILVSSNNTVYKSNRKTDRKSHSSRNRKYNNNHREDARKVLKILREKNPGQPCIPDFVIDHNPSRIPEAIPQMICPKGTEDRCIEIKLPMTVAFYSSSKNHRKLVHKAIYVATGCYELQPIHGISSVHRKREHHQFNRKIKGTIRNSKEPGGPLYSSNSPLTSSANIPNKKRKHHGKLNKQMNRTRINVRGESRPSGQKSQKIF